MKTRIVGLALLLLGCSTALHADPIAITSGQFTITNSLTGAGPMMLSSDRFNIGMFVFSSASPSGFCFTCIPGQNIDFSLRAGDFGGGAGTIDGVSYTGLEIGGHLDFQTTAAPSSTTICRFRCPGSSSPFDGTARSSTFLLSGKDGSPCH